MTVRERSKNGLEPQENALHFTLSQAAKTAGVSKSTLSKAVSQGRLSAERLSDGSFQIEAAELFRVFPKKPSEQASETVREQSRTPSELRETAPRTVEIEGEVRHLREMLERERDEIRQLRGWLDEERTERRALQRQLMPPTSPQTAQEGPSASLAALEPPRRSKGLLSRLMGW